MNRIEQEYFEYIYSYIDDPTSDVSYSKLLSLLYDCEFKAIIDMDINRIEDGKGLRRRFELDTGESRLVIMDAFRDHSYCSILEMMIALALRCEETIMTDDEYGDRTGVWFWNMITSLGLDCMDDESFDERDVYEILDIFINREYRHDGDGGLFTIKKINRDMRKEEIWYQMMWYLDSL